MSVIMLYIIHARARMCVYTHTEINNRNVKVAKESSEEKRFFFVSEKKKRKNTYTCTRTT